MTKRLSFSTGLLGLMLALMLLAGGVIGAQETTPTPTDVLPPPYNRDTD